MSERRSIHRFDPNSKLDWVTLFVLTSAFVVAVTLTVDSIHDAWIKTFGGFHHPRPELLYIAPPDWDVLHYVTLDKHGRIVERTTYELAEVIANLEGWNNPESNPVKWHNPGALVYAGQAHAHKGPKGYAIFDEDGYGWKELLNQINYMLVKRDMKVWDICRSWTGTNDDVYTRSCVHSYQRYIATEEHPENDWQSVPRGPLRRSIDPR